MGGKIPSGAQVPLFCLGSPASPSQRSSQNPSALPEGKNSRKEEFPLISPGITLPLCPTRLAGTGEQLPASSWPLRATLGQPAELWAGGCLRSGLAPVSFSKKALCSSLPFRRFPPFSPGQPKAGRRGLGGGCAVSPAACQPLLREASSTCSCLMSFSGTVPGRGMTAHLEQLTLKGRRGLQQPRLSARCEGGSLSRRCWACTAPNQEASSPPPPRVFLSNSFPAC